MRLSEKRQDELYSAIHESLMDLRIRLSRQGLSAKMDGQIAQVEHTIWRKQRAALNLEPER